MEDYTTRECLNTPVPTWDSLRKEEEKRKKAAERDMRQRIDSQYQKKQTALFDKYHVGFCFGANQVQEYIESQQKLGYNGKFTSCNSICSGLLARSESVHEFVKELSELHKEWRKAKRNAWNMDAYIEHSMWNHEVFYTGDYLEINMVDDVRSYFPEATDEDFERVYYAVQNRKEVEK